MRPSDDVVSASNRSPAFSYGRPQAWSWTARAVVIALIALPVLTVVAYQAWWPDTCFGRAPSASNGESVVELPCSSPDARWVVTYVGVVEAGEPRCPPPSELTGYDPEAHYYYCTEPLAR